MKPSRPCRGNLPLIASAFLLLLPGLPAQEASSGNSQDPPVIVGPIISAVLSDSQLRSLERMVAGYVAETLDAQADLAEGVQTLLPDGEDAPPLPPMSVTGEIRLQDGDLVFSLGTRLGEGETAEVTEAYVSVNDLILRARDLTRRLLEPSAAHEPPPAASPSAPPEFSLLVGTWRGDRGLDKVRIYADGRAVATLSNGVAMALSITFQDGRIVFAQAEEGSWRFYQSASWSMATAREIAQIARPMRWIMALSVDGRWMEGVKESSAVSRGSDGSISVDNDYSREAAWERLY